MLRHARRAYRSCTAHARLVPWPVAALPPLHPRHARALQTSPVPADTATEPAGADEPSGNALPASATPSTPTHDECGNPEPSQPQRPPQQTSQAGEAHADGEGDGVEKDRVGPHWFLRKDRLRRQLAGLREEARRTREGLETLIKRFKAWDERFQELYGGLGGTAADIAHPAELRVLVELLACDTTEDMRTRWMAREKDEQRIAWPRLMMAAMVRFPERATQFLEATLEPSVTSPWAVADVFAFLVLRVTKLEHASRPKERAKLRRLLRQLLSVSQPREFQLQQWVLGGMFSGCRAEEAADLHASLVKYRHPLHWNTQLKIASRLVQNSEYKLAALQLLEEVMKNPEVDVNDRRCAALATKLFTLPKGWDSGRASPVDADVIAEAFERLLALGFLPNVITYTAMIRTLCRTDRPDSAWKIYDVMRSQGTILDSHVYFSLLHGARQARSLDYTIRVLEDAPADVWREPRMWNELMEAILAIATAEARASGDHGPAAVPAFYTMLYVYAKFFKLEPVQRLIPYDLGGRSVAALQNHAGDCWWKAKLAFLLDDLPVSPASELVDPEAHTLSVMMLGYVRSFDTAYPVLAFYSHFRKLLRNRDPAAVAVLSRNTLPYDCILVSLTRHAGMLRVATDIVNDMLADSAASAAAPLDLDAPDPIPATAATITPETDANPDQDEQAQGQEPAPTSSSTTVQPGNNPKKFTHVPFHHPPPSVYTWSILLQAFVTQRRITDAARVARVMRTHGVDPNRATFNLLVAGYAEVQAVDQVRAALEQLDAAGYLPNAHTYRGVAKLADPEPAIALLEARTAARSARHWAELEEAAARAVPLPPAEEEGGKQTEQQSKREKQEVEEEKGTVQKAQELKIRWIESPERSGRDAQVIAARRARLWLRRLDRQRRERREELARTWKGEGDPPLAALEEGDPIFEIGEREKRTREFLGIWNVQEASEGRARSVEDMKRKKRRKGQLKRKVAKKKAAKGKAANSKAAKSKAAGEAAAPGATASASPVDATAPGTTDAATPTEVPLTSSAANPADTPGATDPAVPNTVDPTHAATPPEAATAPGTAAPADPPTAPAADDISVEMLESYLQNYEDTALKSKNATQGPEKGFQAD